MLLATWAADAAARGQGGRFPPGRSSARNSTPSYKGEPDLHAERSELGLIRQEIFYGDKRSSYIGASQILTRSEHGRNHLAFVPKAGERHDPWR